ncbi:APC family permease [Coxiella burnetii]|uniref:APC family permease n=1 Tax=Coxiella burnetii TaxID=777 RepID=UPI000183CF52|nr:APC family permease [Coxiella burnetii]ACJ18936.1 amino acid permease [Coxiella burnetii CbuG_Q212]OYK85475.1 APC family permease [Coxiella burnetii]
MKTRKEVMMKRSVGAPALLFAAIGGIVGSGWLFGPYFASRLAGPSAILAWAVGGGLMMLIALTFAELGSSFPFTGGSVRYLQLSHGPLVGFTMAWIAWISSIAVAPVETLALLHYASNYLPWLMHNVDGQSVLTLPGLITAGFLLAFLCVINSIGVRYLTKTNAIIVGAKLAVPIFTAIVLLFFDFHATNFSSHGFATQGIKGILTALPAAGVIFSFIGYSPVIQLAGEAKNPQRSIPIAIIGALIICIVLYILLQVAFIGALNPASLQHGWQALSFKGDAGPFAGIAMTLGMVWFAKLLYLDAAISPFGTALIYTASTARLGFAMSEGGYLPSSLRKLNRLGVPHRMILLNFVIGLFLFLPFPTWQHMMSFLVSLLVFAYAVGPLSLVVLRKTLPDHARPFRLPMAKTISFLAFYICNLIVYWSGWDVVFKMIIAILVGYVLLGSYLLFKHDKSFNWQWRRFWWMVCYIAGLALISHYGSFGGNHLIPFGWDFIVIASFSASIFGLALYCGVEVQKGEISAAVV